MNYTIYIMLRTYLPTVKLNIRYNQRLFEDLKKKIVGSQECNNECSEDELCNLLARCTSRLDYCNYMRVGSACKLQFPASWDFDLALSAVQAPAVIYSDYIPWKTTREVKPLAQATADSVVVLWNNTSTSRHVICVTFDNASLLNRTLDICKVKHPDATCAGEITHRCVLRTIMRVTPYITRYVCN